MVEHISDLSFARQMSKSQRNRFSFDCPKARANAYSRSQNPAVIALCRTLADMEEADHCVVTSYGFGAILTLCHARLKYGDHIIVANSCFIVHQRAFREAMKQQGVAVSYVESADLDQWRALVRATTRIVFTTPLVIPGQTQARFIRKLSMALLETGFPSQGIELVVDNTAPPVGARLKPLMHGADFVLYTSTRTLEPHSRVVAGAIFGRKRHMFSVERCLKAARVCLSPFNAWAILRGLGAENNQVLDHILGVGSMDDSGTVVSLQGIPHKRHDQLRL